jgi:hypothetical protein
MRISGELTQLNGKLYTVEKAQFNNVPNGTASLTSFLPSLALARSSRWA